MAFTFHVTITASPKWHLRSRPGRWGGRSGRGRESGTWSPRPRRPSSCRGRASCSGAAAGSAPRFRRRRPSRLRSRLLSRRGRRPSHFRCLRRKLIVNVHGFSPGRVIIPAKIRIFGYYEEKKIYK